MGDEKKSNFISKSFLSTVSNFFAPEQRDLHLGPLLEDIRKDVKNVQVSRIAAFTKQLSEFNRLSSSLALCSLPKLKSYEADLISTESALLTFKQQAAARVQQVPQDQKSLNTKQHLQDIRFLNLYGEIEKLNTAVKTVIVGKLYEQLRIEPQNSQQPGPL